MESGEKNGSDTSMGWNDPDSNETPVDVFVDDNKVDEALKFLRNETHEGVVVDLEDEKRLVRKIDWMIVPLMFFTYGLQFLDKSLRELQTTIAFKTIAIRK